MESHVECIHWNITEYSDAMFFCLRLFLWQFSRFDVSGRDISEPFCSKTFCLFECDISADCQYCIIGCIEAIEEVFHLFQCSIHYMAYFFSYCRPAVGVCLVCHLPQNVRHITIWLVQVSLFELLCHHILLYLKAFFIEVKRQHSVAFQPETYFRIVARQSNIIVGYIVVGPRIVLPSGILYRSVVIRNIY